MIHFTFKRLSLLFMATLCSTMLFAQQQSTKRSADGSSYNMEGLMNLVNYITTGEAPSTFDIKTADVNGDEKTDVSDVMAMLDILFTQNHLLGLYHMQRYGLPHTGNSGYPSNTNSASVYTGHLDALTDCYQAQWFNTTLFSNYYQGGLAADKTPLISFNKDWVWEAVSMSWQLIENINSVIGLNQAERDRIVAEAKCLIALQYFNLLPYYGGLPIVRNSESGTEATCGKPRATFEETVNFMVGLLDEAIPVMTFARDETRAESDGFYRFWTAGGAMALKAKILMLAASPLFNNEQGYYGGTTEAEQKHLVWYGNYDASRWQRALQACKDFFDANEANGNPYKLVTAEGTRGQDYRLAYRKGYLTMNSPEVLHATRPYCNYNGGNYGNGGRETAYDSGSSAAYIWASWTALGRNAYLPTQDYIEMFPWSDGTPFDWQTAYNLLYNEDGTMKVTSSGQPNYSARGLNCMFKRGTESSFSQNLINVTLTRDPRLYENALVNGISSSLDWNTAAMSGNINELWENGSYMQSSNSEQKYATGYGVMKYYLGDGGSQRFNGDLQRQPIHYVILSFNEMLLMYAECLAQTGNLTEALSYVNQIRSRVGLTKKLEDVVTTVSTDKDAFIEEILRERACELGMSGNRYFDLVRYMRADWLTKQLHGLKIHRLSQNSTGAWVHYDNPWYGSSDYSSGGKEPRFFDYEKYAIGTGYRTLWGKDPSSLEVKRMFLWPFPAEEVDKGYGLIQNPGW